MRIGRWRVYEDGRYLGTIEVREVIPIVEMSVHYEFVAEGEYDSLSAAVGTHRSMITNETIRKLVRNKQLEHA